MKKRDAIRFNIGGIKCDNPKCDYIDQSVELEDYPNWLNKPCPKCGSNLLTQADYDKIKMIIDLINTINHSVELDVNVNDDKEQVGILTVRMNGTGEVEIESE